MSEEISESVFNKSKYTFGTCEEAKAYREAVSKDLRDNRNMIKRNQKAIIFLLCFLLGIFISAIRGF